MPRFIFLLLFILAPWCEPIRRLFSTANVESAAGTHKILTRRANAAHGYTYLLVMTGSDVYHAAPCDASHYPIGLTSDQPENAEDLLNVTPLGIGDQTRKVRVATALAADVDLFTGGATAGFAQGTPATVGTYYKIGRSVAAAQQASDSSYYIEFAPCQPRRLAVIATATGTAAVDIAALFTALQGAPDLIKTL